ncbi:TVP38/TMEM64 family protein [Haloarchaeobius sp. HRN-SO-5]|uniref:TVP38/TMEM64 family protein n=1 Tax=Haloarchaeobius sp. HRN-SO-5 TaxID=3446118 RepID=UPI003EBA5D1F
MRFDVRRRAAVGTLLAATVVAASLLVSPDVAVEHASAVATDPLLFGVAVCLLYLLRPLVAWPATLLAVVVGYGYGVALGLPVALAGAVVTSLPPFYATRWLGGGRDASGEFTDYGRVRRGATDYFDAAGDVRGVTAARLVPIPADVVSCTAGVSGISLRAFVAGTLLGELPWTVAAVLVGSSANRLTTDGLGSVGLSLSVAMVVVAGTLLARPAYRAYARSTD